MNFVYEITKHAAEEFKNLIYFCTDQGECALDDLPVDELKGLLELLNQRGGKGWELAQMFFGKDGVVVLWKKSV